MNQSSSKWKLKLVLGGSRSGKSDFAEMLASRQGSVAYVATAYPSDEEMASKIAAHQKRRPNGWPTLEAFDGNLADIIENAVVDSLLIDSLTLYVAGLGHNWESAGSHILSVIKAIEDRSFEVIVVSDEVGLGVIPESPDARSFRELLGWANQLLALAADEVYFVVAGMPMTLKGDPLGVGRPYGWHFGLPGRSLAEEELD